MGICRARAYHRTAIRPAGRACLALLQLRRETRFGSYQQKAEIDPAGPFRAKYRTVRGGSWFDYPKAARASSRNTFDESDHSDRFGFRCAGAALK